MECFCGPIKIQNPKKYLKNKLGTWYDKEWEGQTLCRYGPLDIKQGQPVCSKRIIIRNRPHGTVTLILDHEMWQWNWEDL